MKVNTALFTAHQPHFCNLTALTPAPLGLDLSIVDWISSILVFFVFFFFSAALHFFSLNFLIRLG